MDDLYLHTEKETAFIGNDTLESFDKKMLGIFGGGSTTIDRG